MKPIKYFAIRPVRNIDGALADTIEANIKYYKDCGDEVYDPITDTAQNDPSGLQICKDNLEAMKNCDKVLFMWDGKSQGCLFDLGMALALGKPIVPVVGLVPKMSNGKSFQNMVYAWQEGR